MEVLNIFKSVNGEVCQWGQGSWAVFVRFFGCSAQCHYCDTPYSWTKSENKSFKDMSVASIIDKIESYKTKRVVLTGGEPLEQDQAALLLLMTILQSKGYGLSIETNGLHDMSWVKHFLSKVSIVADIKLPSAGKNVYSKVNLKQYSILGPGDFIKCVISSTRDFKVALDSVAFINREKGSMFLPKFYFSPNVATMPPFTLFSLMLKHAPDTIGYNLQLHKTIFGDDWKKEEME